MASVRWLTGLPYQHVSTNSRPRTASLRYDSRLRAWHLSFPRYREKPEAHANGTHAEQIHAAPGMLAVAAATSSSDRVCSPCSSVQFQNETNQPSCKLIPAGFYRVSSSSIAPCEPGTFCANGQSSRCTLGETFQDLPGQSTCKPVTRCTQGQRAVLQPSLTQNAQCVPCPANTYNTDLDHFDTECFLMEDCVPVSAVL